MSNLLAALEKEPLSTGVKRLLRFSTAGSVDDGKSTLIGRLLHDSNSLFLDQMNHLKAKAKQGEIPDWSLLTDGLKAEREQGITIDVAYRYFSTKTRKFIIADTPGHEQYTRNMATGASTADLTLILVDARKGVRTQSRRHAFIASLMGIPNIVVVVNKMDLVDYASESFEQVIQTLGPFMRSLGVGSVQYVPVSALAGDNVVQRSEPMNWYEGPTLLQILEQAEPAKNQNRMSFRFPVQHVLRPHQDYRGYSGQVVSGTVHPGDSVVVLPSRKQTTVVGIELYKNHLNRAQAGMSVTLRLADDLDLGRGDMLAHSSNLPQSGYHFEAKVVWFHQKPLVPGRSYLLKQTTQTTRVQLDQLLYRQNVNTLAREETELLEMNQIGKVALTSFKELHFDAYRDNRRTGSFILIDPTENHTLAAGMIVGHSQASKSVPSTSLPAVVTTSEREKRAGHPRLCLWLSGGSPVQREASAVAIERFLFDRGLQVVRLNSGKLVPGLPSNGALTGFGALTRSVKLFLEAGFVVIAWQDQLDDHLQTGARDSIAKAQLFEISLNNQQSDFSYEHHPGNPWPRLQCHPSDAQISHQIWETLTQNPLFPLHHP